MVVFSTSIIVIALSTRERVEMAPLLSGTTVHGAAIAIVTFKVVENPVTIIVQTIAGFLHCLNRITRGKPFWTAGPGTGAGAPFIRILTDCREAQLNGVVRAFALATLGHALDDAAPFHGRRILTVVTFRTKLTGGAISPTESAFLPIVETDIFYSRRRLAICAGVTGAAEMGVRRNADVDQIRAAGDLFAGPTVRTLFDARFGADLVAHMLHAPAVETIAVVCARVQEAAVARCTDLVYI